MLVPITSARFPSSLTGDAKANAETLAWFGTAYGRRDRPIDQAKAPGSGAILPTVIQCNPATNEATLRRSRYAPFVVLGGVLVALLALRTMPLSPPPALAPVHDPFPVEPAPQIEASQQPTPDVPPTRQEAERLARDASEVVELLTAEPSMEPRAAGITAPSFTMPQRMLPLAVPLGPVTAPPAEARLAGAPAPPPIPRPDPVTVTEPHDIAVQPSPVPVVKANPPAAHRPPAAPPLNLAGNPDLVAGQAHFTKGDLPAARRAFAKAMNTGLPEAAFALGNTFDPVSLAKAGLKDKGDPQIARRWYRRAFELAMFQPGKSRSALRRTGRRGP
jgi:hypothetical protein